jgi:hypothetical protein
MFHSSTTYMAWEYILAGLLSLGQPKVCLPQRGPSPAGIRWFLAGEPGDSGLTALRGGAARSFSACLLAPKRRQQGQEKHKRT